MWCSRSKRKGCHTSTMPPSCLAPGKETSAKPFCRMDHKMVPLVDWYEVKNISRVVLEKPHKVVYLTDIQGKKSKHFTTLNSGH